MKAILNNKITNDIAKLRIAVAILGEDRGWWNTNFFDENAVSFLEYVFPRSKHSNQITACDAIKSLMDKKVGANYFHLFRLDINHEEKIHSYISQGKIDLKNSQDAISVLENLSNGLSIDNSPGPKNIGSIDQLDDNLIQAFAAEYLGAINNDYEVYPYLN